MRFETKRIYIRPYEIKDASGVYEVINNEAIAKQTLHIPYPYPREQVDIWLQFVLKNMSYKKGYEWGIFTYEGQYIGNIGIVNIDWEHKSGEVTYFIGEAYWNKGYASEALFKILEFAFIELKLERIQGRCMKENRASIRVLEKGYFKYEGVARHEFCKSGVFYDIWHAALIKEDYFKTMRL